jgi:hypothetical protein
MTYDTRDLHFAAVVTTYYGVKLHSLYPEEGSSRVPPIMFFSFDIPDQTVESLQALYSDYKMDKLSVNPRALLENLLSLKDALYNELRRYNRPSN